MPPTAVAAPGSLAVMSAKNPPTSTDSIATSSAFYPAVSRQTLQETNAEDEPEALFFDSVASIINLTDSVTRVGSDQPESKQTSGGKSAESKTPIANDQEGAVPEKHDSLAEMIVQHEAPSFADVAAHRDNAPDVSELPPVVPEELASVKAHQVASDPKPVASDAKPVPSAVHEKPKEGTRKLDKNSVDITTTLTEKIEEHKAPDFASVAANKARVPEEVKVAAEIVVDQVIAAEKQHIADTHHDHEGPLTKKTTNQKPQAMEQGPLTKKTINQKPQAIEQKATEAGVDTETPLSEKINEQKAPRFADVAANKAHVPEEVKIAADIVAESVAATEKQHILETTVVDTETPLSEKIEKHKAPSFSSVAANKAHVPVEVNLAADITADKVHSMEKEIISANKLANEIDTETPLAEKIGEHRAPSFADVAGDRAHVPEAVTISADLVAEHVHEEETKHIKEVQKQQKAKEELAKEKKRAERAAKEKAAAVDKQNLTTSTSTLVGNGNGENKSQESQKMPTATLLDRAETKLHETLDKASNTLAVGKPTQTPTTPAPSTTSTVAPSPSITHHETREVFVAHDNRLNSTSGRRYSTGETEAEYAERRRREHKLNRALENRRKLGLASLVFGNATIGAVVGAITVVALAATGGTARLRWMNNVTKTRASGVGIAVGAAMGLIEWIWLGTRQPASPKNE